MGQNGNRHSSPETLTSSKTSDGDPAEESTRTSRYTSEDSLLLDRLIERVPFTRPWVMTAIGIVLLLLPAFFAYVDGVGVKELYADFRAQFMYAPLIVYMLVASHLVQLTREEVAAALRPIVQLDEPTFAALARRGCRISPASELIALGVGMAVGILVNIFFEPIKPGPYSLMRYAYLSRILVYGVVVWTIHVVISMTGLK